MTQEERTKIEERIVDVLKTVYDPEIPVNIYDLGLIYRVEVADDGTVDVDMTFTAPTCPAADFILEDVRQKVDGIEGRSVGCRDTITGVLPTGGALYLKP